MIIVNTKKYEIPENIHNKKLSEYIREDLGLTGTKIGCD
ncbi:MAG TPA: xanthine dehydrogenase, partial [Candidatus Cloacimonas sp.]|nr:xanthine dehydrogenase [Candidatus Cloacimonas sp.]